MRRGGVIRIGALDGTTRCIGCIGVKEDEESGLDSWIERVALFTSSDDGTTTLDEPEVILL